MRRNILTLDRSRARPSIFLPSSLFSKPYDKPLVGVSFLNNDVQVVAGYANGVMRVFDIRAGALFHVRDAGAHNAAKSRMTCMASHRCGTIFATSSAHTVKVWNAECHLLSVAKPHGNFLPRSGAAIHTLAFHPTKHVLGTAGTESLGSIYCSYG